MNSGSLYSLDGGSEAVQANAIFWEWGIITALALVLIVAAAFGHATWNLLAKRASGGAAFVWLFNVIATVIYGPLALILLVLKRPPLGAVSLLCVLGSATIHAAYYLQLQRGYQVGDFSLVYPLARGTGPVFALLVAIAFFRERLTPLAAVGAALIVGGVFVITGGLRLFRGGGSRQAVFRGISTGILIATYTLWDKHAVSVLLIPPLLFDWLTGVGRACLLTPFALGHWSEVRAEWRMHPKEVLGVAVLSPLTYILILTAMVFTPVSYVAPAREISIVIGAVFGTRLLTEGDALRRVAAAGAMLLGVVALAVG